MNDTNRGESLRHGADEREARRKLLDLQSEIAEQIGPHWNVHAPLFIDRIALSRILYLDNLYRMQIDIPGVICEFGVQWGTSLAVLSNLRGIYEPYNYSRKICGFDTFTGFGEPHEKDGSAVKKGDYSSLDGYEARLSEILGLHEVLSPLAHISKFELVKGDASLTITKWLENNPHVIVSMAIFDMDLFKPTRDVLEKLKTRFVKGSLLVFDELNCPRFPGETVALMEVLGLSSLALRRDPHQPYCAWARWE